MNKLRVGDEVQAIVGRDKGKRGKVLKIIASKSGSKKVLVEGVNMVKKSVKPNPQAGTKGGFVQKEASLDISNIALVDSATGNISKVGIKVNADGTKERYFKTTKQIVAGV
jgi:large subunit ribosomal protein L24